MPRFIQRHDDFGAGLIKHELARGIRKLRNARVRNLSDLKRHRAIDGGEGCRRSDGLRRERPRGRIRRQNLNPLVARKFVGVRIAA